MRALIYELSSTELSSTELLFIETLTHANSRDCVIALLATWEYLE
jgi:hypothetical protein